VCSKGACTTTCTAPLVACNRACVDTTKDPLHCGSCTNACKAGESCVGGACVGPKPDAGPDGGGSDGGGGDGGPIADATAGDSGIGNGASPDDFTGSCGCRVAGEERSNDATTIALASCAVALALSRRRRAR
jgi:hypothetical protein